MNWPFYLYLDNYFLVTLLLAFLLVQLFLGLLLWLLCTLLLNFLNLLFFLFLYGINWLTLYLILNIFLISFFWTFFLLPIQFAWLLWRWSYADLSFICNFIFLFQIIPKLLILLCFSPLLSHLFIRCPIIIGPPIILVQIQIIIPPINLNSFLYLLKPIRSFPCILINLILDISTSDDIPDR